MNNAVITLLLATVVAFAQTPFTDSRDSKTYKTVKIGEQVWMAENLNYNADGSKCYDNKPENCEKYGRLYDWGTAMKVCPNGWHLPANVEWDKLYRYADSTRGTRSPCMSETAGKYLKAKEGWVWNKNDDTSGNGEDKFGFAALPGGFGGSVGSFYDVGLNGFWWSGSENSASRAYYRDMYYNDEVACWSNYSELYLFSVRCLKD